MDPQDLTDPENKESLLAFNDGYNIYKRLVEYDYLSHTSASNVIAKFLCQKLSSKFSLLDLGCGDAQISASFLRECHINNYTAIDISAHSLDLARKNMGFLKCPKTFIFDDYIIAMENHPEIQVDIAWVGLSLHHLLAEDKAAFIKRVYNNISPNGFLMIYEHISKPGESREDWFNNYFNKALPQWKALSNQEINKIVDHMRDSDHPETLETYKNIGTQAGFKEVNSIFTDPNGGFQILVFDK